MSEEYPIKVVLPAGKVGLGFKGTPSTIKSIADDCPVKDQVRVGLQVVELNVEGVCEITGFRIPSAILGGALKQYVDSPSRVLYLWDKEKAKMQIGCPEALPSGSNVMPGGSWWKRYRDMADSVNLGDGKDQSFAYVPIYKEPGETGRWLNKYGSQTRPGDEEYPYTIKNEASRMDCTYKVWLPAGKVGVSFKKSPPKVSRISDTSPLAGKIKFGQTIVECSLDGEIMMEGNGISSDSLGQFLVEHAESTTRTLKLTVKDDPGFKSVTASSPGVQAAAAAAAASIPEPVPEPEPEPEPVEPIGETYTVNLPAGTAGLSFKSVPCRISRVTEDGPMSKAGLEVGQQVVGCGIGDKTLLSGAALTSAEVGRFLRDNASAGSDRFLVLTKEPDDEFKEKIKSLRSSVARPARYEIAPPPGAMRGGVWLYKEPGLQGRVVTKDNQKVEYGFTVLVEV